MGSDKNDYDFSALVEIIRRLRDPEHGCPWDRRQQLADMVRCLQAEAEELRIAVEAGAADEISGELGDALWNVLMCLEIARETGVAASVAIADRLKQKMIGRHPHVFGEVKADSLEAAKAAYLAAKRDEK